MSKRLYFIIILEVKTQIRSALMGHRAYCYVQKRIFDGDWDFLGLCITYSLHSGCVQSYPQLLINLHRVQTSAFYCLSMLRGLEGSQIGVGIAIFQLADCSLLTASEEGCLSCLAWSCYICLFFCLSWYMLFSQLPMFYEQQLQQRSHLFCYIEYSVYTQIKLNRMLPSPASSLSSFRDYYRHTSEGSDDVPSSEELILQGLMNFKIVKVFAKLNWKISQETYWNRFYAFKKIKRQYSRADCQAKAKVLFGKLLKKRAYKQSKLIIQANCLRQIWDNVRHERALQLAKLMHFGMKFMKKNYINAAICLQKMMDQSQISSKQTKISAQRLRKIQKLSKAVLCIVLRNIINQKLFKFLRYIKYGHSRQTTGSSQITFFKPKKQKFYQHKRQNKTQQLIKAAKIAHILKKKLYLYMKVFVSNITVEVKRAQTQQSYSDSQQIFANVAQHMVYLTGCINKLQIMNKSQQQQIKLFKLEQVLKKHRRRQRLSLKQYLLKWRRTINQQHLVLRKQILKLEMIKKHYMDEF